MKKIILLSFYYPGYSQRGGERIKLLKERLQQEGLQTVAVVATSLKEKITDEFLAIKDLSFSVNKQKRIHKLFWFFWRMLQEILNIAGFNFSVLCLWKRRVLKKLKAIFRNQEIAILIASYPPLEVLELALELRKHFNCLLITDFRDGLLFEPVEAVRMKKFEQYLIKAEEIERKIVQKSAAIVTVSPPISLYFTQRYKHDFVQTIPNGFDRSNLLESAKSEVQFSRECFNIVYTGTLSYSQVQRNLYCFLQAVDNILKDKYLKKIKLHFAGILTVSEKERLRAVLKKDHFEFYGYLSQEKCLNLQKQADLLLLVTGNNQRSIATGKLFEYIASGRPILNLGSGNFAEQIISETGCGLSVSIDDESKIRSLLISLLKNEPILPERNEEAIKRYSWDYLIKAWLEVIRKVQSLN